MKSQLSSLLTILILIILVLTGYHIFFTPRIAYVDTSKLLVGFSEAARAENELKVENDKWQKQQKALEDSLQAAVNSMSKEYNSAKPARQKELQDLLSARNQQINNFRQANLKKMEKLRQEKMKNVYEKANLFMAEYGKTHNYSIIFGTVVGGSILYGNEDRYDITAKIVKGLNERYK